MIWTGIGIALFPASTARAVNGTVYVQLTARSSSGNDTVLSGLLPGGTRTALIGKIS